MSASLFPGLQEASSQKVIADRVFSLGTKLAQRKTRDGLFEVPQPCAKFVMGIKRPDVLGDKFDKICAMPDPRTPQDPQTHAMRFSSPTQLSGGSVMTRLFIQVRPLSFPYKLTTYLVLQTWCQSIEEDVAFFCLSSYTGTIYLIRQGNGIYISQAYEPSDKPSLKAVRVLLHAKGQAGKI